MSRKFWAFTAVAMFVLASFSVGEVFGQGTTRGGTTTGGTGGTGTTRGGTGTTGTSGFGGQTGGTGTAQGLATGIGGVTGTNVNQNLQSQTQNLQTLLNQNRNTTQNQQRVTIQNQVPVRIQFPVMSPRPATVAAAAPVQAKLSRVMSNRGFGSAVAMWEGDVLVLTGTVANEAVRRQLEGVAYLEPGVRTVRNETVVGPVAEVSAQ